MSSDDFLWQTQAFTETDPALQARAHTLLAAAAVSRDDFADAVTHGNMAIGLALAFGRADLLDSALHPCATALIFLGEHAQAIELFEARSCLAPAAQPASLEERVISDITEAEAWLGRSQSLRGAANAAGPRKALAQARECAERAGGAACEGGVPRLRVLAFEILTEVLLEADDTGSARAWRQRVRGPGDVDRDPGAWRHAVFQLNAVKIDMRESVDPASDLTRLELLEAGSHACFQSGRRRRQLMHCLWQAFERCGDFRHALSWRKQWVEAQAEVDAVQAREQLKLTRRALQTLRGEAHHFITDALRAPLKAARDCLAQVCSAEIQDATRAKVQRAARSTQRALDIAEQYLNVMNAEYTQRQELRPLDLGELTRDVCEHANLGPCTAVALHQDIEPDVLVMGDAGLLSRALANLVENACQHAPAGSNVRVQLSCRDGVAVLSVSDHGPGLPLAMRTRLFERYASGRGEGGNGLGLALVARVARLHDARVAVQTPDGQGTMVTLSIKTVPIDFAVRPA